MHCKGIYSPIGECKCRCTVMTDSAITMQLTYYRGHFHRLLPSPRTGQGCQVTVEGRQAYLPVARREAEALKLQASLKELTCVGDREGQGDPDGFQELTPMRRPPGARAIKRAMCIRVRREIDTEAASQKARKMKAKVLADLPTDLSIRTIH